MNDTEYIDELEKSLIVDDDQTQAGPDRPKGPATPKPRSKDDPAPTAERPDEPTDKSIESVAKSSDGDGQEAQSGGRPMPKVRPKVAASYDQEGDKRWRNKRFGQYRLVRSLGQGAMGIVFLARDSELERDVALKVLRKQVAGLDSKKQLDLFLREARAAAALNHPNIVEIYQAGQIAGWRYISMEFLEGGSLKDTVAKGGTMDPHDACLVMADAAAGLAEAHSAGIIHRDVKPSNLMLTRHGRCKVTDFGVVRMDDGQAELNFDENIVGSPYYVAPEIINRDGAEPRSDVYSLACTFYYVLTGKNPYTGQSRDEVFNKHLKSPIPDVRELCAECPTPVAQLLKLGMAKEAAARPRAQQFANTLRMAIASTTAQTGSYGIGGGGPVATDPSATGQLSGTDARALSGGGSSMTWVAIVLLLIVLGGGGAFYYSTLKQNNQPTPGAGSGVQPKPVPQKQYTMDEVVPIKAQANSAWQGIEQVDKGQGVGDALSRASVLLLEADTYFKEHEFDKAREKYLELQSLCDEIGATIALREQAAGVRAAADSTRERATTPVTDTVAGEDYAAGVAAFDEAAQLFESGEFEQAEAKWDQAAKRFGAAAKVAAAYQGYQAAQKKHAQSLSGVDRDRVNKYAGDAWKQAQAAAADAASAAEHSDWSRAEQAYASALAMLTRASDEADRAFAAERKKMQETRAKRVADLLDTARKNNSRQNGAKALAALEELEKLDPGNATAKTLRSDIEETLRIKPGETITNKIGITLAYVPAGRFVMGTPPTESERDIDEREHPVVLTEPYYIGVTEVTQAQWDKVMGKDYVSPWGVHPNDATGDRFLGPELPEDGASYHEAVEFCKKLSEMTGQTYRLPTEAEWEYACRAGTKSPFSFGDQLTSDQANIDGYESYNGSPEGGQWRERTLPVASFLPNAWGIYDMHGNVAEWCTDWRSDYPLGEVTDPTGPEDGGDPNTATKVIRGGSWKHPAKIARSGNRTYQFPQYKANYIGFRVVRELPEKK